MEMQLPVDGDVKHWSIPRVVDWLMSYGMGAYIRHFQNGYIDGEKLLGLTPEALRNLGVQPHHTGPMLRAIRKYNEFNPDNDYEYGSDVEDEFVDDDYNSINQDYLPPDDLSAIQQQRRDVCPPNPSDFPEESYEVPDQEDQPPLPPRPGKPQSLAKPVPARPPHQAENVHPPARPPQKQEAPPPANNVKPPSKFRAAPPKPTPQAPVQDHLNSLPESFAPGPPQNHLPPKPGKGFRPAAPLPGTNPIAKPDKPPPLPTNRHRQNEHISVEPVVPIGESLESDDQTDYEEMDPNQDQENYEVVEDTPAPNSNTSTLGSSSGSLGRPPGRSGALPKTPSDDEEGSRELVSALNNRFNNGAHTKRAGTARNQYPVVILPPQKKKSIPSYTDHQLHPTPDGNNPHSTVTSPSSPVSPPPSVQKPVRQPSPTPQHPFSHSTPSNSHRSSGTKSPVPDATGMTIQQRMALLTANGNTPLGKGPPHAKKPANMLADIMTKQNERRNPPSSNNRSGSHAGGKQLNNSDSEPHPLPSAKPAHSAVRRQEVEQRPPIPTSSHPSIPILPTSNGRFAPDVPQSARPPRRGSIDSACSNQSLEEERGLYSYSWYHSNISRAESMALLMNRRGVRGAFIVRKSTKDPSKPYTLDVMYDEHDFHIPLRKRDDGHFAMGTPHPNEDHWRTVPDLVAYFMSHSLALTRRVNGVEIKKSTLLLQ